YSGNPTIQSNDSFPSSSPIKTSDSTFEEFTDEFTLPNSLPSSDDVSILKKDLQEDTFQIISNPLFEFDDSFKSSNVNPLFEENDKDVEIKSSTFVTLVGKYKSKGQSTAKWKIKVLLNKKVKVLPVKDRSTAVDIGTIK
ncbi:hypothetical protein Tco_0310266, partial [Tanacetum coccineum]